MADRMQLALRKLEDAHYPAEPKPRRSVGQWFKRELASMAHDHVAAGRQMVVQRKAKPVDRVIEPWTQIRRKSQFHQLVWREITDTSPCGFLRAIVWVIPVLFVIGLLAGCTQAQRDAWNQPMTPQQSMALMGIAQNFQNQMHQQQMLNLQRQQLYNAQQPARLQTQCFSFEGILTCR